MRRLATILALLLLLGLGAGARRAAAAQGWHSQQPAGEGGFPALLGEVGDVECWDGEANRCMLITAGNGGVAAGLFAFDGSGWYRYSTVCGGHEGRIAWAGPDDFWTISDQQAGQATRVGPGSEKFRISLCHFKNGQVVASYAKPIGVADSYLPMDAAACSGPSDCWFAGERLPGTLNQGAFHLHWNGNELTAVPSPTKFSELADPGRRISALAYSGGSFYESVKVQSGDTPNAEEEEREKDEPGIGPSLLHRIVPGAAAPFEPLFPEAPLSFGEPGTAAEELEGLHLTGDEQRLWAIAGAERSSASLTVLQLGAEGLAQVPLDDPDRALNPGDSVGGAAAEPGLDDVWVGFSRGSDEVLSSPARLARIESDGTVSPEVTLPAPGEEIDGEEIGDKGSAGPITCPEAEQCWMATKAGWLFHLGPDPAPNGDPAMHVLVTFRPPDESLPVLPPIELPEDNSGANVGPSSQEAIPNQSEELPRRQPALVSRVKQRLIGGTVLELNFSLRAKAHVQLVARRKGRVVAKTKRYTMVRGRHSLRLPLDPKQWPTKLDLQAKAVGQGGSK